MDENLDRIGVRRETQTNAIEKKPTFPVMVFTHDYKPAVGGIPQHSYWVAFHLARKGYDVVVLTRRYKGNNDVDLGDPFSTFRVPWIPILGWMFYLAAALYLSVRRGVRIVFCANCYPCGLIMRVVRLLLPVKFTVVIHGHEVMYGDYNLRQKIKKTLKPLHIWAFMNGADRIFTVSRFLAEAAIAAGASKEKVRVIYNGVNMEEIEEVKADPGLREKFGIGQRRIILTVARFERKKGIDMVIKALPKVLREIPDVVYVVVGYGEIRQELEELSSGIGVKDSVIFAVGISRNETISLLKMCDVLVMPSRVEGFGIVFLEASACGKPVIGGRSGGIPEAIVDGVTGLLVDPNSPEEIAEAIKKLLIDRELATTLGRNGYERVRREFTWERVVDLAVDSFLDLISQAR